MVDHQQNRLGAAGLLYYDCGSLGSQTPLGSVVASASHDVAQTRKQDTVVNIVQCVHVLCS